MFKKLFIIFSIFFVLLITTGFSLTTWKMFEFRDRLHAVTYNSRWESNLDTCGAYSGRKIVFFGDSQIALWPMSLSFGSMPIINRGISGDWASRAVNRFERDVIEQTPQTAVILIGTNDLAHGATPAEISSHVGSMVDKATNNGIDVILCSVLPVRGQYVNDHPEPLLLDLNLRLSKVAIDRSIPFIDLYSKLADNEGLFSSELTADGLHPSQAGYVVMSQALLPHIAKVFTE